MVKTNDPGIARRVYFVQRLQRRGSEREGEEEGGDVLGDESGFGENGQESSEVESRSPHPLTCDPSLRQDQLVVEDGDGDDIDDLRDIDGQ